MSISTWVRGVGSRESPWRNYRDVQWTGRHSRHRKQNVWRPGGVKSKEFNVAKSGMQVCIEEKTVRDDKGKQVVTRSKAPSPSMPGNLHFIL